MNSIRRALVSVYDKTGVVSFVKFLKASGVEVISTGGTADLLRRSGLRVREVSDVTRFPEMLDGRVKTLHPKIHGGILALRDNPRHMRAIQKRGIQPIDLLVVNLYPFGEAVRTKTEERDILEMIDIGGPAMLRSAAKNFRFVAAAAEPSDYAPIMKEMKRTGGFLSEATRRRLAAKAFKLTASYDGLVARYFERRPAAEGALPERVTFDFEKAQDLRYGENPHQKGAIYRERGSRVSGIAGTRKLHGKELSFNNMLDLDAAFEMAEAFEAPACAIIKHTSPCGFATAKDACTAFRSAYRCDPLSAFGSILGFNMPVDEKTAREILKSGFIECIAATAFTPRALKILKRKKNLRLVVVPREKRPEALDFKKVRGGLLVQERDLKEPAAQGLKCVTRLSPSPSQIRDLLFAFKVCRYVKSNAIVVARNGTTLGLGMGQPSRVDACETAFKKAGRRARGAVLASDGFFPKQDSIRLAQKYGIRAIIQPGGSIQDEAVIRACNRAGIRMVFTGIRHFRH